MSDILEEIQELSNKFSNLFEVDDLGQPAMDVPPSQNKIKRDRKTKDGKVELVSVEDELFPYEGNKREQYRQKILDTINNMIQGKATLEDLLQFVRQKKAPLKEAMEVLEDIKGTIKKKYGKPDKEYYYYPLEPGEEYEPEEHSVGVPKKNKSAELTDKAARAQYNEVQGAAKREGKSEKDILIKRKETKNSEGMRKTRHRSDIVADPWSNDKMDWFKYGSNDADRVKKSIARHEKKEQKKAPLKEAMEVLEELLSENIVSATISKYGEPKYRVGTGENGAPVYLPKNKSAELMNSIYQVQDKKQRDVQKREGSKAVEQQEIRAQGEDTKNAKGALKTESKQYNPSTFDSRAYTKPEKEVIGAAIARHEKKEQKKAPLKEAMEVLENLGSYIQNKYGDSKEGKELYDKYFQNFNKEANAAITKERVEDIEKKDKKPLEHYVKKFLDKRNETKNSKGEFKTDSRRDVVDQEYVNLDRENDPEGKKATQKSIDRHFDKVLYKPLKGQANITRKAVATEKFKRMNSEALKEAMDILETALTAIRNSGLPKEKQQELTSKLAKGRAKERELADEKAFKSWAKGDRKQLDVQTVRDPEFTKNASGERKTRLRSHSNNYTKSGGRKIKPEWKQVEDSIKRHEKKAKLAEALSLMEAIINEISDKTANSFLEKRVINALDAWYNNDDLNKKEDDAVKALIKRKRRQGKELSDDEKKRIEEAVINELHPNTVNNALDKRTEQSIEADDKERDEFNNILKIKDRDERAKAYKEFKKKADDRFAKEDKKLDLYFNYAKRHPELVKESLRDQIDKKVKAGEINLDKALKLDKKIEDKMSSEKNAQEYSDELDKRAKKERLGDRAVAKSIRRNERKGACEALELAEAIINEVSLKKWKEAAANSIDKRKEDADNTSKAAEQSWDDYEEGSRKHPEEEDALYKRAWHNDIVAKKAEQKADHASDVLRIKAKGKSANKTIKAAKNSEIKRNDAYLQNTDPEKFDKLRNRMEKTDQLVMADPVKSRNEVD